MEILLVYVAALTPAHDAAQADVGAYARGQRLRPVAGGHHGLECRQIQHVCRGPRRIINGVCCRARLQLFNNAGYKI